MRLIAWLAPGTISASVLALAWATFMTRAPIAHAEGSRGKGARVELSFMPTDRAQIAVWAEKSDGTFMGTLALTHAVSTLGIGNRPGALQMNSGFRWPYGRREGVLPVWAHRRAAAVGAKQWKRVIFQQRIEGFASRTFADMSVDDYFCLSFKMGTQGRDNLDAVTCASVFSSDKGRFITQDDVDNGYAEPWEDEDGNDTWRALSLHSLYPPRRDVDRCTASGCYDHEDLSDFKAHALEVMPELDAVARATPPGDNRTTWVFELPIDWPTDSDYVLFIEVAVEGDYNDAFNDTTYPTPVWTRSQWDMWAEDFGYPYRGQPSVVYSVPFRIDGADRLPTVTAIGYGALHGEHGEIAPLDQTITADHETHPGVGADRLRLENGTRAQLRVTQPDPCALDDAPDECGLPCKDDGDCRELICDQESRTCQAYCVIMPVANAVQDLRVQEHRDGLRAHMWADLTFRVPESARPISSYEIRVKAQGGEWDQAFTYDREQELLPVALDVCADPENPVANRCLGMKPGTEVKVVLANLRQSTSYQIEVTPRDETCQELGGKASAEFTTPVRKFTTVSPCFVATAAYGTPLAREIGVLRAVRDRYLAPHAPGRALIAGYYHVGPTLAELVREHAWLRTPTQAMLSWLVTLAAWWTP